jgi:hypothetical protein
MGNKGQNGEELQDKDEGCRRTRLEGHGRTRQEGTCRTIQARHRRTRRKDKTGRIQGKSHGGHCRNDQMQGAGKPLQGKTRSTLKFKAGKFLKYRKDIIGRDRKKVKPAMRSRSTYV